MPDKVQISYRDSGRTTTESFDPDRSTEIAVDGPSIIRVGRDIDPLPEFGERRMEWFTGRQVELLDALAGVIDDHGSAPDTGEVREYDVPDPSTYYRHFDLPWSEIVALAREYE